MCVCVCVCVCECVCRCVCVCVCVCVRIEQVTRNQVDYRAREARGRNAADGVRTPPGDEEAVRVVDLLVHVVVLGEHVPHLRANR